MEPIEGLTLAKAGLDLVKNEKVLDKATNVMGMMFPYASLKSKALEVYINEIEKSDLAMDIKVSLILNAKRTFKQLKNQKAIADIALNNAKEGTDFSEESQVNEEWLDRFMDSAGFVSSEEMQLIWGKILANEFEAPGTTPPNMLRILSEITPALATVFKKICSMKVAIFPETSEGKLDKGFTKLFIPYDVQNSKNLRDMGIRFEDLTELETLGVIHFDASVGYVTTGVSSKRALICYGDKVKLIENYVEDKIPIGGVILTSAGKALRNITSEDDLDNYFELVQDFLKRKQLRFVEEHNYEAKEKDGMVTIISSVKEK